MKMTLRAAISLLLMPTIGSAQKLSVSFSSAALLGHIKILASDEFEGRSPGSPGEDKTVAYLTEQFKSFGLQPGNPNGTYVQPVPLVGITGAAEAVFSTPKESWTPNFPDEFVGGSRRFAPSVSIEDSDVIFVGYGIVAPEYKWDDYKDVDVAGKTLLMLVNDPPIPGRGEGGLDDRMFKGRAMTYYGRWTYKYEIASLKKAAAAIIIHETGPAGYPYDVIKHSHGRENFDIAQPGGNADRVAIEAWISSSSAVHLLAMDGKKFDDLKKAALSPKFRPISVGVKARFRVNNKIREVLSANVVARLPGSDPALRDEHIIYTAHWDHFGVDEKLEGDKIFNGALDNASGTSALLEIASAFAHGPAPKRSILFAAVTAEERGLLGSKYYAANPLYPLEKTLAVINMDSFNPWGPTRDIVSVGMGLSTLDAVFNDVARDQGRIVKPDPTPEKGTYFRSDHFEFAKKGVPALNYGGGTEFVGKDPEFGKRHREDYVANDYHKPSDEVKPDWDLSGAVLDMSLLWDAGRRIADGDKFPEWAPTAEFKATRDTAFGRAPR